MLLLHVGQRIQEVCETTAAACGFRDAGSDGGGHGASPAACEPQIANRGRRPVIAARSLCTCPPLFPPHYVAGDTDALP